MNEHLLTERVTLLLTVRFAREVAGDAVVEVIAAHHALAQVYVRNMRDGQLRWQLASIFKPCTPLEALAFST